MMQDLLFVSLQTALAIAFLGSSTTLDGPSSITYKLVIENQKMMRYNSNNITMLEFSKSDDGLIDPLKPSHGILVTYPCDVRSFTIFIVLFTLMYSVFTYFKTPESNQNAHKIEPDDNYSTDSMQEHKTWNIYFWLLYGLQTCLFILITCSPLSVYTLPFLSLAFFIFVMLICEPYDDSSARNLPAFFFLATSITLFTHSRTDVRAGHILSVVKVFLDISLCMSHANSKATMGSVLTSRLAYNTLVMVVFIAVYTGWSYL